MFWEPLQRGDLIDIVAPAWPYPPSDYKKAMNFSIDNFFEFRMQHKGSFELDGHKSPNGCMDVDSRADGLERAFYSEDSKAILCLRGGYGCMHLLPILSQWKKPKKCKPLIGFSDISILHYFVNKKWHWPSLHGPMLPHLTNPLRSSKDKKELFNVLQGKTSTLHYQNLTPLNLLAKRTKKIKGQLIGGNLTTLQTLIGMPLPLQTKDKILFLEEVNEPGYKIDRILFHLDFAGAFKGVKAIVLGQFLKGQTLASSHHALEVLKSFFYSFEKPVYRGLPCGHGKRQRVLPLNTDCILQRRAKEWEMICQTGIKCG